MCNNCLVSLSKRLPVSRRSDLFVPPVCKVGENIQSSWAGHTGVDVLVKKNNIFRNPNK